MEYELGRRDRADRLHCDGLQKVQVDPEAAPDCGFTNKKRAAEKANPLISFGGAEEDRTPDLMTASHIKSLSQAYDIT